MRKDSREGCPFCCVKYLTLVFSGRASYRSKVMISVCDCNAGGIICTSFYGCVVFTG